MTLRWRHGPHTVHGWSRKGKPVELRCGVSDTDGITVKIGEEIVTLDPLPAIEFANSVRHFAGVRLGWRKP